MSLSINNNYTNANTTNGIDKTMRSGMQRIASGAKVNKAADDAAAYAILTRMYANIGAYSQQTANVQNTNAMLQTTAAGSGDVLDSLAEIRSSLTDLQNTATASPAIASESIAGSLATVDSLAGSTQYNGKNLLDGSQKVTIPEGQGYTQQTLPDLRTASLGLTDNKGNSTLELSSSSGISASLAKVDAAMDKVLDSQTTLGAMQQNLAYAADNYTAQDENLTAAASNMGDTDMAKEASKLKSAQVQQQLSIYVQKLNQHDNAGVLKLLQ
jgi:flagellin